jgi:HD-GYP domain-containing protein (c-di-GMP phosphodiesterase class II)
MVSPYSEIMADARAARVRNMIILGIAILIAIGIGLDFSKRLSRALQDLSGQSATIRQFKLDKPIFIESSIKEVDELATNMVVMQSAITRFVEIARALSAEKKMERVLEMILDEAVVICRADGGGIGLVSDDETSLSYVLTKNKKLSLHSGGESKTDINHEPILLGEGQISIENNVKLTGKSYSCADVSKESFDFSVLQRFHAEAEYQCVSLLVIPLLNRKDEMIGVLHLVNARSAKGTVQPFSSSRITYVEALSSNAALALDNNRLLRAQKDLFDSFVRLIASAIDTKSPYTGGHCQRVPVLSSMLAEAASASTDPAFKNFTMSEEEKYELHVASWLHDCGKVTTPEYVVDKATKLETIYNRIHEVRTRFEILWRDAEISYLQNSSKNGADKKQLQEQLELRQQQLRDDFAFIAQCNLGGEFMAPELLQRLQELAEQTWVRHFDDSIGLSDDELARFTTAPETTLPCTEHLLADKEFHIFKHLKKEKNNPEFCMHKPPLLYNQGELYNLEIAKGTLTNEERYKINDHVVQTINMLSSLPFPKEIRRVPSWAGNHHEKLDGTGYPRCLTGKDLSFPERIMAIADIFEALSAADRPYKKPKTLSNCIKIMSFMVKDGHVCPDLFKLFLTSGLYLEYAQKHMQPGQIDQVVVTDYI